MLRTLLQQVGVEPEIVADGRQAVDAHRSQTWDLIHMDVQAPVLDGVKATELIRAHEAAAGLRRTPVVALTANVMAHQTTAYAAAGMDEVVAKPIDATSLPCAIQRCLAGDGDSACARERRRCPVMGKAKARTSAQQGGP